MDARLDVGNVLKGMAAKSGLKETIECVVAENARLAGVFKELSSSKYKKGDNIKGRLLKKCQCALAREHTARERHRRAGGRRSRPPDLSRSTADKTLRRSRNFPRARSSKKMRAAGRA